MRRRHARNAGVPTTLLLVAAFLAGLWRSPIVRTEHRHTISTLAFMAACAAFVPPLSLWTTDGDAGRARWSWGLDWQLLVHVLLPGIMFGTTLLASGRSGYLRNLPKSARSVAMHYVESAPEELVTPLRIAIRTAALEGQPCAAASEGPSSPLALQDKRSILSCKRQSGIFLITLNCLL